MVALETNEPLLDEPLSAKHITFTGQIVRRLLSDPSAIAGMVLFGLMVVLAIIAPYIARYGPDTVDINSLNFVPSGAHWFGTDYLGRDMWSRVLYGGRISLPAGLGVIAISFGVGVPFGLIAGYAGGFADDLIMRSVDVILSFPAILLAILVLAVLGPSLESAVIAVGVAVIPGPARLARGSTLRAREYEFVEAARAQGASRRYILLRHILPNVIDPLIVLATLTLGSAIISLAALSFLGLGTQPPASDWGTLLSNGYEHMFESWSEVTFPGLAIIIVTLGINLLGDGLSDAFDPRQWSR
jgi:ABC-type dipeptide/oligopeptide/nickel transport system permease subunit